MEYGKTSLQPHHETASDEENQGNNQRDNCVFFHAR